MTMPCERYRAVLRTEEFLRDIMKGKYDDNLNDLFYEARRCLKHFPREYDMKQVAENCDRFDDVDFNGVKIKW
jgi:hypothetical protein